ncbi:hypothetical protein AJ88_37565 [Mesorhizobium amorphae CCBAU 01583]|nr:hypothetical protein AJ88_37565 [Mesorhizobium amorphae CCBAU 01583]
MLIAGSPTRLTVLAANLLLRGATIEASAKSKYTFATTRPIAPGNVHLLSLRNTSLGIGKARLLKDDILRVPFHKLFSESEHSLFSSSSYLPKHVGDVSCQPQPLPFRLQPTLMPKYGNTWAAFAGSRIVAQGLDHVLEWK